MSDRGGTYILSRKKVSNFYFSGQQCTVMCFNGGTCVKDTCVCKEGFSENFCQTRKFFFRIKKFFIWVESKAILVCHHCTFDWLKKILEPYFKPIRRQ